MWFVPYNNNLEYKITCFVGNSRWEVILNNSKIKMHISIGVGGQGCLALVYSRR